MAVTVLPIKVPFKVPIAPGVALDRSVNVFVIAGEDLALIDTGVKGSEKLIFERIRSLGRRPQEVKRIVLTHSHPDHIGAAPEIVAATGCEVLAHQAERSWIERPAVQKAERPVPGFDTLVSGPVLVDRLVADGDEIDVGGSVLSVVHTPGHSPGSISLWSGETRTLFTGDAVPVPGDIPIYDDAFATIRSLRRIRSIGRIDTMLSAWDGPREGVEINQRLDAATLLVQTIHRSVVRHSHGPEVSKELVAAVLKDIGLPPDQANPLVARTVLSHLRYKYNLAQ